MRRKWLPSVEQISIGISYAKLFRTFTHMFYIVKTVSKQRVPRTGWVYRNVEKPESVSDHMYRMAVMALVTEDKQLNKDRCVRLALVHDMAECIVGDIAPADNISKEEKHQREEAAMKHLTQLLSEDLRKEIYELWEEYEHQSTAEARFVKELDQCEMILQASEYEELEKMPGRLQDFYDSTSDPSGTTTFLWVPTALLHLLQQVKRRHGLLIN
nr:HD domain-containing protein 2 isoform X3 [Chelonoidis abingdonii]